MGTKLTAQLHAAGLLSERDSVAHGHTDARPFAERSEERIQAQTAAPISERPLFEAIAYAFQAILNCQQSGNQDWEARHSERLERLCKEHLPSGSGFDAGTQFDHDSSRPDCLVFATSFHHMNAAGYYSGWTEHRVVIHPSFIGRFDIKVTGRDKSGIKDYIAESFQIALSQTVREYPED